MVEGSNLGNPAVGHALARRHLTSRTPHLAVPTRFRGELPATPAVLSVIMCLACAVVPRAGFEPATSAF